MNRTVRCNLKLVIVVLVMAFGLSMLYDAKAEVKETSGASMRESALQPVTVDGAAAHSPTQRNPFETFPTSLHATRRGKATWYSAENGGFETLTGIPIEQLTCIRCHPGTRADGTPINTATYRPDCSDCHVRIGDPVPDQTCLKCHSRQGLEIRLGYPDVHRAAGFKCTNCHTSREMHGDGTEYISWLQPGAMDVKCETCHTQVATQNVSHLIHFRSVDCTACHTQSVITCFNCHFESEVAGDRKRPYGVLRDYLLLLRREGSGKVHAGTFMALTYQGKSFYALAPYRAHTIVRNARTCQDCHNSPALREYLQTGRITVTMWDGNQIVNTKGVIPVPPDWSQALQFDFVNYTGDPTAAQTDPTKWVFLKSGADQNQMLFAQPLTAEQINKLRTFGQ